MTTPQRFVAGAIDLAEVKARAEQRAQALAQPATSQPAATVTLTMDNVEQELIKRSAEVPVVVLIGTPRSPDSEQLKADLSALAQEAALQFIFGYIDADATPEVARMFGIQGLPTVVAIAAGQPIANFEGGQPRQALEQWINAVIKAVAGQLTGLAQQETPEDPQFAAATQALNNGDFLAAIEVYDTILAKEPKNQQALQARDNAKFLYRLQQNKDQPDPIAYARMHPDDIDAAFQAADAYIAASQPEEAFSLLLDLLETKTGDDKATIKDRLVELFALYEAHDPRVLKARARMASALF
ncbi:tetratricopeptide repeat protein [Corynebacterium sp. sy017]|uniref:tetratricopeptide repeat protein n=1 Tax=unclassified Corynebacterium TaxID=2624378 RepID=UPI00118673F8|nr:MULTISPECIES: tetratricopeptide repeat protein [unclassified Corynebacterium]MBP3089024.1 tetratricopeptide repeat protein [Corynebacterium sp. sy017]QDZ42391.1 tetratricopeptide repeat protein [Corynebacterium sp. sy039]TSD91346.1 tetratricopeptide repeat protein [Corynebacterium sp. SY003]